MVLLVVMELVNHHIHVELKVQQNILVLVQAVTLQTLQLLKMLVQSIVITIMEIHQEH